MLPRTLFGRSALLIALLIILSQAISALLFLYFVQRPRVQMMSDIAESHLQSIRAALSLIPDNQRNAYVKALGNSHSLLLQTESPTTQNKAEPPAFVVRQFLKLFEKKLKPHERLIYQTQPEQAVWVNILVDQKPYWIRFQAEQFNSNLGSHWLDIFILMSLLTLSGSYIIHRTLNKPLKQLTQAVKKIGEGHRIEQIQEEGPDEVVTLIRSINRMNSDLSKIEDDRAMMLAGISHDLRTPITRIQLAVELIGGDFDKELKCKVFANLSEIENGLTQCLDYARNNSDEMLKLIDLNDLARLCASNYRANGHEISLNLCEEAQLMARPFAMERLLKNLLDNAVKYANKDISICTLHEQNLLHISVLDRGDGISKEDITQLRRPFTRASTSRGGKSGYGLGLAIVDKIVESHQASIAYLPRLGGGLEVRISLNALAT